MTARERYNLCMSTKIGEIISEEFKKYLLVNDFFFAPASTKYHGAYEGGLFDHSLTVMNSLVELSEKMVSIGREKKVHSLSECFMTFVKLISIVTPRKFIPMTRAIFIINILGSTTQILCSKVMVINRLCFCHSTLY